MESPISPFVVFICSTPSLSPSLCLVAKNNRKEKRKHIGVLGFCTALILGFFFFFLGSISWKDFAKTFVNFDIKKPFGLSFCYFFCLINWNSFSAFITTLRTYQMMHWIIKHALQNLGCKSKTKYTDYLPRTKAYLFSKKIKEIWNQRLFVCWENDRKRVRKK